MKTTKGTIFNIQKFSITDGTGIRTLVFMKGCPLHCMWCSNPEAQEAGIEIMNVRPNCVMCGKCHKICPNYAISKNNFEIDRSRCINCGMCSAVCYANAKKTVGREYELYEILELIDRDRVFFKNSGGGVTVGGGEPLYQAEFVSELLKNCQLMNINTAVETCGYGKWESIGKVFEYSDHVFFDLKMMDSDRHEKMTGAPNDIILSNARRVAETGRNITFRIPLIQGINDDCENMTETGIFIADVASCGRMGQITAEILPYHNYGSDKYKWMDREYRFSELQKPSDEVVLRCKELLEAEGVKLV